MPRKYAHQKNDILKHWASLTPNQPVTPKPIDYKHEGTTYVEDGIRITGTKTFVDSVLSRLKDLLAFENASTRLNIVYKHPPIKGEIADSWCAYISVIERGGSAREKADLLAELAQQKQE